MPCRRCGSTQVYSLPHIYLRGSSVHALNRHEKHILEREAEHFPDNIFDTNYLHLPLDLLGTFDPALIGSATRERRAAAYVAAPPPTRPIIPALLTLVFSFFVAFIWFSAQTPTPHLINTMAFTLPGLCHFGITLHYNFVTRRAALERWKHSSMCLTCGTMDFPF